jgi:putative protease
MMADVEAQAAAPGPIISSRFTADLPRPEVASRRPVEVRVSRTPSRASGRNPVGIWLSETTASNIGRSAATDLWIWLPPVVWPDDEARVVGLLRQSLENGAASSCSTCPGSWPCSTAPRD